MRETLVRILACPLCQGPIQAQIERVTCMACGRTYPLRDGIPWMRPEDANRTEPQPQPAQPRVGESSGWRRMARQLPLASPICKTRAGRERIPAFINRVRQTNPDAIILNIGSGSTAYDAVVNIDVAPFAHVEVVGDAIALPVLDSVLDAVVTQGVLEHVRQPHQAVSEIRRVLKPGGLSLHELPFMQGDHTASDCPDFWRFTLSGAESLFQGFQVLERGVAVGPSSALTWLLRDYLAILLSFNNIYLHRAAMRLMALVTFPLKYLDHLVARSRFASTIASAFYVVVQRPPGATEVGSEGVV